jgi:glycosyltransferase involved in cell wall biosynthesis
VEVLPAFLASGDEEVESYGSSIEAFLESGRVLVVSAYRIGFLQGQSELYGLDTACDAFIELASEHDDMRLAIFIARRPSGPRSRRHLAQLEKRLEDAGLRDRVLIVFGLPLVPALRRNTLYLRPTRAEGDAVSVREAQRAGVPVVASDVVGRPDGVVLFPAGSAEGLQRSIESVLDQLSGPVREAPAVRYVAREQDPFETALIRLYKTELAAKDVLGDRPENT